MPYIQQVIDSRTFTEYQIYYKLEPFGDDLIDLHLSQITAILANQNRPKGKHYHRPEDFRTWTVQKEKQSPEDIIQRFINWASAQRRT